MARDGYMSKPSGSIHEQMNKTMLTASNEFIQYFNYCFNCIKVHQFRWYFYTHPRPTFPPRIFTFKMNIYTHNLMYRNWMTSQWDENRREEKKKWEKIKHFRETCLQDYCIKFNLIWNLTFKFSLCNKQ